MEVTQIGELCLPTGKIVAADPGDLDNRIEEYFHREVAPGKYSVDLAIRHTGPIGEPSKFAKTACMRVRFCDDPIAEWIIATTRCLLIEVSPARRPEGYRFIRGGAKLCSPELLVREARQS